MAAYDHQNIFARILRGEIPCNRVLETPHSLAFHDIAPGAPVHVLVIPKGAYVTYADFAREASEAEVVDFVRAIGTVAAQMGVVEAGFRLIANAGADARQEVQHLHVHVYGGADLGRNLARPDG